MHTVVLEVQASLKPRNRVPTAGVARRVTGVPLKKSAEHMPWLGRQFRPAGVDTIVAFPLPSFMRMMLVRSR